MTAPKTIAASAMIALAQSTGAQDEEPLRTPQQSRPGKSPSTIVSNLPAAPGLSKVQAVLAKKRQQRLAIRDQRKTSSDERSVQARGQASEMKAAASASRQDFNQSLEEAKAKAHEQARKLAQETREVLRSGGPSGDF
jgi:hypothetical protein